MKFWDMLKNVFTSEAAGEDPDIKAEDFDRNLLIESENEAVEQLVSKVFNGFFRADFHKRRLWRKLQKEISLKKGIKYINPDNLIEEYKSNPKWHKARETMGLSLQ